MTSMLSGIMAAGVSASVSSMMLPLMLWLAAAYPSRIQSKVRFRAAVWLFLIAITLPLFSSMSSRSDPIGPENRDSYFSAMRWTLGLSHATCLVAVVLAFETVIPKNAESKTAADLE